MGLAFFDLDGTISNPSQGITGAINYALEQLGYPGRSKRELLKYIGPPLSSVFTELLPECDVEKGITLFRYYYITKGFRQNFMYPGMRDVLCSLQHSGHSLCIITGKKTSTANEVLDLFQLTDIFTSVLGCGDGGTKAELLNSLLQDTDGNAVMIGDRIMDFEAAAATGIPSIGVKWGFGSPGELKMATVSVACPCDLPGVLKSFLEE